MTADGVKFAHPLHHLQKSKEDLPLIAIDSFRHMYLFPKTDEMEVPGKLKQVNICIIYILYLHISYITYYMADSKFDWLPQTPDTQHLYWYISNLEPTMSTTQEIEDVLGMPSKKKKINHYIVL